MTRKWTKEETEFLISNYPKISSVVLAGLLGRTAKSVQIFAGKRGLKKCPSFKSHDRLGKHERPPEKERFEKKFRVTPGCWIWEACQGHRGYGRFGTNGKTVLAHRVSYRLYVGPISDDIHVLHKCDNPKCINPDHLFLGTHQDNMDDRSRKGRCRNKWTRLKEAE